MVDLLFQFFSKFLFLLLLCSEVPFDLKLLGRYRKALDTAVKIATVYNVQPIKGRTVIFCDIGSQMELPCTAARGLGKPRQVGTLVYQPHTLHVRVVGELTGRICLCWLS